MLGISCGLICGNRALSGRARCATPPTTPPRRRMPPTACPRGGLLERQRAGLLFGDEDALVAHDRKRRFAAALGGRLAQVLEGAADAFLKT
jgi:hypothetical protein